jgi:hypothetical protein
MHFQLPSDQPRTDSVGYDPGPGFFQIMSPEMLFSQTDVIINNTTISDNTNGLPWITAAHRIFMTQDRCTKENMDDKAWQTLMVSPDTKIAKPMHPYADEEFDISTGCFGGASSQTVRAKSEFNSRTGLGLSTWNDWDRTWEFNCLALAVHDAPQAEAPVL